MHLSASSTVGHLRGYDMALDTYSDMISDCLSIIEPIN